MTQSKRYIVRDVRATQNTHLTGKIREPWQVIDTLTQKIFDAFLSKRAADSTAKHMNRYPEEI
jgi:hypothetical protein